MKYHERLTNHDKSPIHQKHVHHTAANIKQGIFLKHVLSFETCLLLSLPTFISNNTFPNTQLVDNTYKNEKTKRSPRNFVKSLNFVKILLKL